MSHYVHIPSRILTEVVELLAGGLSIDRLAAECGFSAVTLRKRLFEQGLPDTKRLAREWVGDRDSIWLRQIEDIVDADDGIDISIIGRPELTGLALLKSDLRIQGETPVNLVEATFEWNGDYWHLVRCRHYVENRFISLRSAEKLKSGKQIVGILDHVRPQPERVRFQAKVWLHKFSTGRWFIFPAVVASRGHALYRKASEQ